MDGWCENCGKRIEVRMCCSGRECGCMGLPIDPPVCSDVCYLAWKKKRDDEFGKDLKGYEIPGPE